MIDATLQELWAIKDNIAKEQGYDLDSLLCYLNNKYHPNSETAKAQAPLTEDTELANPIPGKLTLSHPSEAHGPGKA